MPDPTQQYQYIKLPDGSYGKFAANASDDQIKSSILKDFPDAYGKQQTAGSRYAESLGISPNADPSELGIQGLKDAAMGGPAIGLIRMLYGVGKDAYQGFKQANANTENVAQRYKSGQISRDQATAEANKAAIPALRGFPVFGRTMEGMATDKSAGNYGAMAGGGAGILTQLAIPELTRGASRLPFLKAAARVAELPPTAQVPTARPSLPAYESDVDMITRRAPAREGFTGEKPRTGFGTAPGNVPIEERMTPPQPNSNEGLYGKTKQRSNLKKNQRQLASPTGSTAPTPKQQVEFVPKENPTPEDLAFQNEHMEDILAATIGQLKRNPKLPFLPK